MKLGLIGCGSIGRFLVRAVNEEGRVANARFALVMEVEERVSAVAEEAAGYGCAVTARLGDVLHSDVDLVVEAAATEAVRRYVPALLEHGKDVLVMSVGALADPEFVAEVRGMCERGGRKLHLPSGAIGGLDALRAAMGDRVDSVRLTTRKPPRALLPSASAGGEGLDLRTITEPTVVFEGTAVDAIRLFPRNVNVAVALSLAGLGGEATRVCMVADPATERNVHEIEVTGAFGRMVLRFENEPMADNPKTSRLAALSALAVLQGLSAPLRVGA